MEYNGAVDNQTSAQKAKNYHFNEIVTSPAPVVWVEKPQSAWRKFPIRNQDGSGQCVVMTKSKEESIIIKQKTGEYVEMSSSFAYQQRHNPSVSGCDSVDVYDGFPKIGNVYESLMPSQNINDEQAMAVPRPQYLKDIAEVYKMKRIVLPIDFETVASTIQETGKGVMLWFRFSYDEWKDIPIVIDKPTTSGHSVTAVDFILKDGKKYLVIDDSWGLQYAMNGQRLISEEYFNARCFLASYLLNFKYEPVTEKPKFDGSIVSAQKCFQYEGLMPTNVQNVEVWGPITRTACIAFQKKYNIEPTFGNFGPKTRTKLNELYPNI